MSAAALPLRVRALKASGWGMAWFAGSQLLRLGGNLIMTRLLVPEAFGVMAIGWTVMTGLALVTDTGTRQCIVQSRRGDDPAFLHTAWAIQIGRGALIALAALAAAAALELARRFGLLPAASAWAHPDLPPVLAAISLSALMTGFESTRLSAAYRHLALARVTAIDLGCQALGLAAMVAWALVRPDVWALVVGVVVVGPARIAASHLALPGHADRWRWDAAAAREILQFGKWIVLSSLLGFLVMNGDRLVLGALVDAATLGQFALAALIVGSVQQFINAAVGHIALPTLSEIRRSSPARLGEVFYRMRMPLDVGVLALVGVLFAAGSRLTGILYDERYQLAGPMLEILSLSLFAARYELAAQCYLALGRSQLVFPAAAARLLPLFVFTPLAFHLWGLMPAIAVIAAAPLFSVPVHWVLMRRLGLLDARRELIVLPSLFAGLLLGRALA